MSEMAPPGWIRPVGPRDKPKVAIVGDFPTQDDTALGVPFMGHSGNLLTKVLREAGLNRSDCFLTNVFLEAPPPLLEPLEGWTITKTEHREFGPPRMPPIYKTRYLHPDRMRSLQRLKLELEQVRPNLVITTGAIASWALLQEKAIRNSRGSMAMSTLIPGLKVLPTYSPNTVMKQWDLYPIFSADIKKAARSCHTPINLIPRRVLWLNPTFEDLDIYYERFIDNGSSQAIAVDVETKAKQITCIGFAPSKETAIVVPFWDHHTPGGEPNFWKTQEEEVRAMLWCKKVLQHPRKKVFQNGMYDMSYIWKIWGMPMVNCTEDTMLLHHSLQPELMKGLGFLGSVYCDSPSWKFMRKEKMDTEKREE